MPVQFDLDQLLGPHGTLILLIIAVGTLWSVVVFFARDVKKRLDDCHTNHQKLEVEIKDLTQKLLEVTEQHAYIKGKLDLLESQAPKIMTAEQMKQMFQECLDTLVKGD